MAPFEIEVEYRSSFDESIITFTNFSDEFRCNNEGCAGCIEWTKSKINHRASNGWHLVSCGSPEFRMSEKRLFLPGSNSDLDCQRVLIRNEYLGEVLFAIEEYLSQFKDIKKTEEILEAWC